MKFINKYFTIIFLVILATSCKKELDLRPTDSIDDLRAFKDVNDLQQGLNGVNSSFGAGLVSNYYIASLLADEVKISNENRGQGQFAFKWEINSQEDDVTSAYGTFYRAIDRANRTLAASINISGATPAEETQKKRVVAELTAFRAMAHFHLLTRHMPAGYDAAAPGVPIVKVSSLSGKPSRNTVGEVVSFIETELAAARAVAELPNTTTASLQIGKAAIAAYQARVALLKRDFTAAAQFATDAITLSGTTLATRAQFPAVFTDAINTEVLLRFRNNYSPQVLWRDVNGDVFFEPADKLKAQYNRTADIRFLTYFGSDLAGGQEDTSIVIKFPGSSFSPQINDVKDIRIAEMYLIRAEARAELNNLNGAADDINLIRNARILNNVNVSFVTRDEAISFIMNERYRELPFEGFRFFDLKRRSLGVQRFASDVQSAIWQNLAGNDYRMALPIPNAEILANPNTTQNPGY
jgi:starch-binding outer membrane protein, SusD/RagB family